MVYSYRDKRSHKIVNQLGNVNVQSSDVAKSKIKKQQTLHEERRPTRSCKARIDRADCSTKTKVSQSNEMCTDDAHTHFVEVEECGTMCQH